MVCLTSGFAQNKTTITKELYVNTNNLSSNKLNIKKIDFYPYNDTSKIHNPVYLKKNINKKAIIDLKYYAVKPKGMNLNKSENNKFTKLTLVKNHNKSLAKLKYKKQI